MLGPWRRYILVGLDVFLSQRSRPWRWPSWWVASVMLSSRRDKRHLLGHLAERAQPWPTRKGLPATDVTGIPAPRLVPRTRRAPAIRAASRAPTCRLAARAAGRSG
jgi:hypothetical protein